MKISFTHQDDTMPRTLFWEIFREALQKNHRFVDDQSKADLLFPAEDFAFETNWPRYGLRKTSWLRGEFDKDKVSLYSQWMFQETKPLCLVNLFPPHRLPVIFNERRNIIVADCCLSRWERSLNPRSISFPAMPVNKGVPTLGPRPLLAVFSGALSHPCRAPLIALHDGQRIHCQAPLPELYCGQVDAQNGTVDGNYAKLMSQATFAFVPRGDCLFSYRLLESMSYGAIPVILSDGWVLPFDRTVQWDEFSIHLPESQGSESVKIFKSFPESRVETLQKSSSEAWWTHFHSIEAIVDSLLKEIEYVL